MPVLLLGCMWSGKYVFIFRYMGHIMQHQFLLSMDKEQHQLLGDILPQNYLYHSSGLKNPDISSSKLNTMIFWPDVTGSRYSRQRFMKIQPLRVSHWRTQKCPLLISQNPGEMFSFYFLFQTQVGTSPPDTQSSLARKSSLGLAAHFPHCTLKQHAFYGCQITTFLIFTIPSKRNEGQEAVQQLLSVKAV